MEELGGRFILENVAPDRVERKKGLRNKAPGHQGPVRVASPSVKAGHERSKRHLDACQPEERRRPRRGPLWSRTTISPQFQPEPETI